MLNAEEEDPFRVIFNYGAVRVCVYFAEDGLWHADADHRSGANLFLDYALAEALDVPAADAIRMATAIINRVAAAAAPTDVT